MKQAPEIVFSDGKNARISITVTNLSNKIKPVYLLGFSNGRAGATRQDKDLDISFTGIEGLNYKDFILSLCQWRYMTKALKYSVSNPSQLRFKLYFGRDSFIPCSETSVSPGGILRKELGLSKKILKTITNIKVTNFICMIDDALYAHIFIYPKQRVTLDLFIESYTTQSPTINF